MFVVNPNGIEVFLHFDTIKFRTENGKHEFVLGSGEMEDIVVPVEGDLETDELVLYDISATTCLKLSHVADIIKPRDHDQD